MVKILYKVLHKFRLAFSKIGTLGLHQKLIIVHLGFILQRILGYLKSKLKLDLKKDF